MSNSGVVHVIDDDEAVRDSLAFMLENADLVVETYESAVQFLDRLPGAKPGCIVTDVRMPEMTGLDLVAELKSRGVGMPVMVMTGHGDVPLAVEAMRAGVVDFIEKPFAEEVILKAVRDALAQGREEGDRAEEKQAIGRRLASLSARERQVLNGLLDGQANKVVARELGISPRTVEIYRANLMTKMGASGLSALVRMVMIADRST
jgi:two-component system response regulator FixJ